MRPPKQLLSLLFGSLLLPLITFTPQSAEAAPVTITVQGNLRVTGGAPVPNGNYPVTFRLFTVASSGSAIFTEAHASVPVADGYYSVELGSVASLDSALFTGNVFLEVQADLNGNGLGAEDVFAPRRKFTSVPFAVSSLTPGPQGPQGDPGPAGATGATGAQGPQGNPGAAGATGATGAQGPQGDPGPAGATGATGAQGPQGNPGAAGATGATGAQGPQGDPGPAGATGAQGPQGNPGAAGATGATGAAGSNGSNGASFLSGTGTPSNGLGVNGDSYLDRSTGLVWTKSGGTWTNTTNSLQGPAGATGATGATGAAGANGSADTGDQIVTKINASAGGLDGAKLNGLSVAAAQIANTTITAGKVANDTLTNTQIVNRTRRIMISNGQFVATGASTGTGSANFSASQERYRAGALSLGNTVNNVATATFVVPSDYVAGAPGKMTVWWATDESAAGRAVDVDVSFNTLSSLTTTTTDVTFRYNFRSGSGAAANAMDSLVPNQGQVVQQTLPEGAETYTGSPSWTAGDIIVLSIGRNGASASDPNAGNFFLYGVSFDYTSDM